MRTTWKRILVMFLVVAMLMTDSSLSEVIYAAGQSMQTGDAIGGPADTDEEDADNAGAGGSSDSELSEEGNTDTGTPGAGAPADEGGKTGNGAEAADTDEGKPAGEDTDADPDADEDTDTDTANAQAGGSVDEADIDVQKSDLSINSLSVPTYLSAGDEELTEDQQKIVDTAKALYGDSENRGNSSLVRYDYALQSTEPYMAGQEILIKVNQKLYSPVNVSYSGTNRFIADTVNQMQATLQLPEGLSFKDCDLGTNTYLESCSYNEKTRELTLKYKDSFSMPSSQSTSSFVIHMIVDGNGEKADQAEIEIDDIKVSDFSAGLPILDYPNGSAEKIYDLTVKHSYAEMDSVANVITLTSPDAWGVVASTDIQPDTGFEWVYDEEGNIVMTWTVAAALQDPDAAEDAGIDQKLYITDSKLLQALDPSLGEGALLQASLNQVYHNPGRAPLAEESEDSENPVVPYELTSLVYALKDGIPVYPASLEIRLVTEEGDVPLTSEEGALVATAGSESAEQGVKLSNYLIEGEEGTIGANAPMYSTYKVTAVFPKETFITPFYEELKEYEFVNKVQLTSTVAGKEEQTETFEATGTYSGYTTAYPVELTQIISMGDGMDFVYDAENLKGILDPFQGTAAYSLEKKNADGGWTPYKFYERRSDGADTFTISSEGTGTHLGTTTLYLEEGVYRLRVDDGNTKIESAELKGYSDGPSSEGASTEYKFTVGASGEEDEENPLAVYINYEATGTRILFNVMDQEKDGVPLAGAVYTLYDEDGNEIKAIHSTESGHVVFAALGKGTYTLKETKAPEGYILDETKYTINTTENGVVNFYPTDEKVLYNENNTHESGTVTIEKYLSKFQDGEYESSPQAIANDAYSTSFNTSTFRVEENVDGQWQTSEDVRVHVSEGKLQLTELRKYELDSTGKKEELARYRIVEILPDNYDNSPQNEGAASENKDGQRTVVYPEFTVKDVFGYGTDEPDDAETFKYYNEQINRLTISQKLLDGQRSVQGIPDSSVTLKIFYRLSEDGELEEYTPSEPFEPTTGAGETSISGLPTAMKDEEGNYVSVQWYIGQTCGEYEQIEYKNGNDYVQAQQETLGGQVWNLIPFDFSGSADVKLESYRLVMKWALTVYKTDAETRNFVSGAQFSVSYGENLEAVQSGSGNSQTGMTYWVPMSETIAIEEVQAPTGYIKGGKVSLEPKVAKEEWGQVNPDNYSSYASRGLDGNKHYYNDDAFPVLQVKKLNYTYDGVTNISTDAEPETVKFVLYKRTEGSNGTPVFTECKAVYEDGSYKSELYNGTLNYIEPGESYYLAEVYEDDPALSGYIDPAWLEGSGVSAAGVVYQDGRAYYPIESQKANGGTTTSIITNYSNTSGQLSVSVEEARTELSFDLGTVKIQAVATGKDGKEYRYEAEVVGGNAQFNGMQIFDADGSKLTYTITQSEDHPDYSHDSSSYEVQLKIGEQTEIDNEEEYDFVEYPRVDVYMQVNWVEDLTYGQLSEEEKSSAQQRLAGAVINVYQKKANPETGEEYYELIRTCTSNENGTLIAEGLEEFESYVFVKAGYDPQRHEEALSPEATGTKKFDKNRYSTEETITISPEELAEKYDYIEYEYGNQDANSSITTGIVSQLDTVKTPILFHELWMQVSTTKQRYYTSDLDGDGKYDGIFRITRNEDDLDTPWHYDQYPTSTFSNADQYGEIKKSGDWTEEELQDYIKRTTVDKNGKSGVYGRVVYDKDGNPLSILYGTFYSGQNARYNLYRVKLADLTGEQVEVDEDGRMTISIDFKSGSGWELVDNEMATDETGETISREQVADDGYIYFLVETQAPSSSMGLTASNEILGTHYVTVYYKSGAEYTFNGVTSAVKDITFQCITVNANGTVSSGNGYVGTSVRPYNIDVDTDDIQLNKGYIGQDSNYTGNYAYIQFNKWKENRAYDAEDPTNGEHKYAPVSSAKFDVYLTNVSHSFKKKLNTRTYQTVRSTYSSDAYATTEAFYWNSQYGAYLEAVLKAYASKQGSGPSTLAELRKTYWESVEDVSGLNDYVQQAMETCGGKYKDIFYISNVVTNTAEKPEDILNAADARKDTYSYWGFSPSGTQSSAKSLLTSGDESVRAKAEEVINSENKYFDLFDTESDANKNAAIGFAQQVAYNYCMCYNKSNSVDYAVVDGFPTDGEGVKTGDENSYGKRTGTYRIVYMHCSILEVEAPAGTFLNTDYKDLMLQSGSYVHRTNGGNWGSFWETYTLYYANTYVGKSNMNGASPINRTWYYSDEKLINQLGDVEKAKYIALGTVGNVTYRGAAKFNGNDTNNQYINKDAADEQEIVYKNLTASATHTGYIPGKPYIDETQAGFTVRVQSVGYPSQLSTYGKTDNELQELYEANELSIRPGQLAAEYKLQKLNDEGTEYEDFVYPKVLADGLGHVRGEEEAEEACILRTYEENDDEDGGSDRQKASMFTFPQGLGTGVYRLVPVGDHEEGTLIGADEFSLNQYYYDPYTEAGACRYFTVSRTSADQYVEVFYPELPNVRVIKRENSASNDPYRTTDSIVFALTGENGYSDSSAGNPMNTAEFEYLPEGTYELEESLVSSSGDLTDLYYKENSGLEIEVIRKEEGNHKQQTLVGTSTDENGVTITKNYEVDAPVFYGYQIVSTSGSVVAPERQVTEDSTDASATSAITMATTFQVYVTNPKKQRFQVQKLDALNRKGLANAEFDVYFRPFDVNSVTVDSETSNNKVALSTPPNAPSVSGDDGKLTGNGWTFAAAYISNSNGLLMDQDQEQQKIGIYGAPGWYYVVETKAPTGMSYDIADPILFAFTGTLQVEDLSDGSIQCAVSGDYIQIHDSDKVELKVSKYFTSSGLTDAHTISDYSMSLYQDADCTVPAMLYNYADGVYTGRNGSEILKGTEGYTVRAGTDDFSAGSGTVYVDYNDSGVYYLKETMTASSEEEAQYWIAQCAEKGTSGYRASEYVTSSTDGNTVTVIWKLKGFSGETVNNAHQVDARVWNTYASASVKMFKTISTNTAYALGGAEFELYDNNNVVLATAVSSGTAITEGAQRYNVEFIVPFSQEDLTGDVGAVDGKPIFSERSFLIKETKAPAGYQVSSEVWTGTAQAGQTLYLKDAYGKDYIDSDGITFSVTKYDNVESAVQRRAEKDQGFALYVKTDEGWNQVGNSLYTGTQGNIVFPAVSVGTDQERFQYALKYEGARNPGNASTYAVDSLKISVNNQDHYIEGTEVNGETYYILNGDESGIAFVAGMTYGITVYDVPKSSLAVSKLVMKKDDTEVSGKAVFGLHKLTEGENLTDGASVKTAIAGYKETDYQSSPALGSTYTFTGLTAGRYLVWEISSDSTIALDDSSVVWYQIVDIDPSANQGKNNYTTFLKNRESSVAPSIGKTVVPEKVASLMDGPAELTYMITPGLEPKNTDDVQQALTSYVVKDTGLSFYTDADTKASEAPDYWFTELGLTAPSYTDGSVGTFEAAVTFYGKNGAVVGTEKQTLPISNWDISSYRAASFEISYRDIRYADVHSGYAVGENLSAGEIAVKAHVEESVQSRSLQEIRAIKNSSSLEIQSKAWGRSFAESVKEEKNSQKASASAITAVEAVSVPVLGVTKIVDPKTEVTVSSNLEYKIYAYNLSSTPMQNTVLIDHLPKGLSVDTADGFFTLKRYNGEHKPLKTLQAGTDVTVSSFTSRGRTALVFQIVNDQLGNGEYYELGLMKERCTVTNDAVEAGTLVNEAYVTALEKGYQYDKNQSGNAFKAENSANAGLDNSAMEESLLKDAEQALGGPLYGVLKAETENEVSPGTGLVPAKSEQGDRDGVSAWISAPAAVAQVSRNEGTVEYRLSVTNGEGADKKDIILFDVLPYVGDRAGSQWTLELGDLSKVQVTKTSVDKNTEELQVDKDYSVTPGKHPENYQGGQETVDDYEKIEWATSPDASEVYDAVKFQYNGTLRQDETLTVTFQAKVSTTATKAELDAWTYQEALNQFGVFSNTNGTPDESSAVYSNTVKAQLVPETVALEGQLWIDADQNNVQNDSVTDIYKYEVVKQLISNLKLTLNSYQKADSTATKVGDTVFGDDGTYQFAGLTPARPIAAKLNQLYVSGGLNPLALLGSAVTYRLALTYSGADQDLIALANPGEHTSYSYWNEAAKVEEGYEDIVIGEQTLEAVQDSMKTDSDIRSAGGLNGTSDQFFLFSAADSDNVDVVTNDQEDVGVQVNRKVTITKKDSLGNLLEGVEFTLYQYPMGTDFTDVENGKEIGSYTTDENGQISFTVNYFNDYKLVETSNSEAYSGKTVLESAYGDIKQSADKTWIIQCIGTGERYSKLREAVTITNELATGSIQFRKQKEDGNGALTNAAETDDFQFSLSYKGNDSVGLQAWDAYLRNIASQQAALLIGCSYVAVQDSSLIVKVTGGITRISGLPMGTYQIQEVKAQGYVAVDEAEITLTANGQTGLIYNKETETAGLLTRAFRSMKSAALNLLGVDESTTKVKVSSADETVSDNILVNYRNHAQLTVVKTGDDGNGEKKLAGAEFTLCEDADGDHTSEAAASHASCAQTVYTIEDAESGVIISFDDLELGDHHFYLRETGSPGELWEVNKTLWHITVTVEAGKQPTIQVGNTDSASSFSENILTVKDKYLKRDGSISYAGTKKINNGAVSDSTLNTEAKESMKFFLYKAALIPNSNDYKVESETSTNASFNKETGSFTFENFDSYNETDHNKTFYYAVCEDEIQEEYADYLSKDSTWYVLQVYVQNDPENAGKMKAEVTEIYSSADYDEASGIIKSVSKAANGLTFNNQYTTKADSYSLKVQKHLTGRELASQDEFSAVLTQYVKSNGALIPATGFRMEAAFERDANDQYTGTASFTDKLNVFESAGFYYYQITEYKETPGSDGVYRKDGVAYDMNSYYLLFWVEDNGEGSMTPTLIGTYNSVDACLEGQTEYEAQQSSTGLIAFLRNLVAPAPVQAEDGTFDLTGTISFENVYTAEPASLQLTVGKTLTGRPIGGNEFKLKIEGADKKSKGCVGTDGQNEQWVSAATGSTSGTAVFDKLTFQKEGEYIFHVTERQDVSVSKYVTYDKTQYTVKVTVEDGGDGQLYVTKVTARKGEEQEQIVYEPEAGVSGMSSGTLNLSETVNFQNTYSSEATLTISGTKTVTDEDGGCLPLDVLTTQKFCMKLQQTDSNYVVLNGKDSKSAETSPGTGAYSFEKLLYNENSFSSGQSEANFYYVVTEEDASTSGFVKNETEYRIHVILTRNDDGSLSLRAEKEDGKSLTLNELPMTSTTTTAYGLSGQDFTNVYNAEGTLTLRGTKELIGKNLVSGMFKFLVKDGQGNVVTEGSNDENGVVTFDQTLSYTAADIGKTFSYTVSEDETSLATGYSMNGANSHSLIVKVADEGNGKLMVSAYIDQSLADPSENKAEGNNGAYTISENSGLSFSNTYSLNKITLNLVAYKSVNGDTDLTPYLDAEPEFKFSLYEATYNSETGTITRGDLVSEQTEKIVKLESHSVIFENITYDEKSLFDESTGKYVDALTKYYLIEEEELSQNVKDKNFTKGGGRIAVKVELSTSSDGSLGGKPSYAQVKEDGTVGEFGTETEKETIDNIYRDGLTLNMSGTVNLESAIRDMADQSFTVTVSGGNLKGEKKFTVGGSGELDKKKSAGYSSDEPVFVYDQSDVGKTYDYTVTQTSMTQNNTSYVRNDSKFGAADGYTADTVTYHIKVTVGVDSSGKLTAAYEIPELRTVEGAGSVGTFASDGTNASDGTFSGLDFTNKYEASGDILIRESTTFRAVNGTDTTVQQWLDKNVQSGFDYKVYVIANANDEPSDTDTALAGGSSVRGDFPTQAVTNAPDQSKLQQTSSIADEAASLFQTGENYTDQKSELGTFYYYVEQTIPANAENDIFAGLTYGSDGSDTIHAYVVKAEVTDDPAANGRLKVTYSVQAKKSGADWSAESEEGPVLPFTNSYEASGTVTLAGTKTLNNRNMTANEFTFTLKRNTAENTDNKTSSLGDTTLSKGSPEAAAGEKSASFQWMQEGKDYTDSYTSVGTYTYLAEETKPLPNGVKASEGASVSGETLTVEVKDAHDGTLTTKVTGSLAQDAVADFVNTYESSGSISISGKKTINGQSVAGYADNRFKFGLYEGADYNVKVGEDTSSADTGIFTIMDSYTHDDMVVNGSYQKEVTKTYFLKETGAVVEDANYTMGGGQYLITVTLTDDQKGNISAYISEIKNVTGKQQSEWNTVEGKEYGTGVLARITGQTADENNLIFNNTYSTNTTAMISGTKTAQGFTFTTGADSVTDKTFENSHFAFLLYNCSEQGEIAEGAQPIDIAELNISDDGSGSITTGSFSFDALTFRYTDGSGENGDDTGSHYYKIVEAAAETTYTTGTDSHLPDKSSESKSLTKVSDMLYSEESYVVEVKVSYNSSTGELTATPSVVRACGQTAADNTAVNFTNTYPTGTFTIPVVSAYEAAPGTNTTYNESQVTYSYKMTPVDENGKSLNNAPSESAGNTVNMSGESYMDSTAVNTGNINSVSAGKEFAVQTVHNTDTRYYKIEQTETGSNAGMTYDEGYYIVKITTDFDTNDGTKLTSSISAVTYYDKDGKLTELEPTNPIRFTNVYHADPLSLSFQATKVLTGRYMNAGEFSFTLTGEAGSNVYGYTSYTNTQSNAAAKADTADTVVFGKDTYNGTGTYQYELKENASGKISVTDDTTEYKLTVTVEDNHAGKLVFADGSGVTIDSSGAYSYNFDSLKGENKAADFVNAYTSSGSLTLNGKKTVNGLAVNAVYEDKGSKDNSVYKNTTDEFSFTLTETDENGQDLSGQEPDTKRFTELATADGTGAFNLNISYDQDDMRTADSQSRDFSAYGRTVEADTSVSGSARSQVVYHYYRLEENETKDGYEKSPDTYLIKVALVDNYDGTITASVDGISKNGESLTQTNVSETGTVLTFDNTYTASGSIELQGTKLTSGFALNEPDTYVYADEFQFELYEADKNGKYDGTKVLQTKGLDTETTAGTYKNTFTFSPISYQLNAEKKQVDLGDHYYVIRETSGSTKGMVYDTREYLVRVNVSDAGYNAKTKENELSAVIKEVSQLTANKLLLFQWTTLDPVQSISFKNVYQSGGIDLYATNRYVAEAGTDTNLAALNEAQGDEKTAFSFVLNLSDEDGKIVDTAGLEGLKLSETKTVKYEGNSGTNDFVEEVQPADGGTAERATFDFLHMKENDLKVLKEWLNDLNFHSTGDFYLRIDQVIPEEKAEGVTYDDGYYLIKITVTNPEADADGYASSTLDAKVSSVEYYSKDGERQRSEIDEEKLSQDNLASVIVFTNVYRAASTGLTLQTKKTTDKRSMEKGEFEFALTGTDGTAWKAENGEQKTALTASNEAAKAGQAANVVFDRMVFDGVGKYTYKLTETKPDNALGGIAYDESVYTFTVEVTDDHKGALHNAITSIMEDGKELLPEGESIAIDDAKDAVTVLSDYISFLNAYTIAGEAEITVDGVKTINGRSADLFANNKFTFDLLPAEYDETSGAYKVLGAADDADEPADDADEPADDADETVDDADETVDDADKPADDAGETVKAVDTAESAIPDGAFRLKMEFTQDDLFTEDGNGNPVWNRTIDYYYIITERAPEDTGYELNDASIGIKVTLTDNLDGTLSAKITEMKVQSGTGTGTAEVVEDAESGQRSIHFDNVYRAEGELEIAGTKRLEGADLASTGAFTFEIVDETGKVIGTAANDANGKIRFIIPCDESFIGETRIYRLREVNDARSRYTYDETEYQLKLTVTDTGNGELELSSELLLGGKSAGTAAFVNYYKPKKKHGSGDEEETGQQSGIGILLPQTGDTTEIAGYIFMMIAAAGGIFTVGKKRRKKNTRGK